ncbi:SusC/RagA family TonB-linked outer membrane protein [Flavihumibacter petaseus]|uniref:Putative TonB-dependent receptor n=1 Tax=Flavihumibacter petaseus NBRC 106054 TaxID=1220578 RepID=A0A0E9MWM7_9BACT|nr:TonB-dependent receptor [Flavihumibacter petaseus]GAO42152.1 putative TonB-dependent receptor [Flavihumibacter petaseus NBRC 106054]
MKKFFMMMLLFGSLAGTVVQGQDGSREVSGRIVDAKGVGIPNVTVKVKGTSGGVTTDQDGNYKIKVPSKSAVLQFSSVGYVTQEQLTSNQSAISLTLESSSKKLDEVVVVGYGTSKKKDLTGSVSSVSRDDLNLGGATSNMAQAIQGRAAGVQVSQTNAAPGGETTIRIRGGNSIKSTNEPLYVVDGFISSTGKDISPADIEDIQILKDASATAIYGSRGANGVVLITTRRGKTGKPSIAVEGYYGVQSVIKEPELMNATDYMNITNAKAVENGNPPEFTDAELNSGVNTNWFKEGTRNATVQNYDVSVGGGTEDSHISLSGNYFQQDGALLKTNYKRYSGRLNMDKTFGGKFKVGANVYAARAFSEYKTYDGNIVPSNVLYGLMFTSPSIPVYNANGTYATRKGRDNPMAWLLEPTNDRYQNKFTGNVFVDYEIIKGLTAHVSGGTEIFTTKEGYYLPTTLISGAKVKGQASVKDVSSIRNLFEGYLTYRKQFGDHSLSVMGGVSQQNDVTDEHYTQVQKFTTDKYLYWNLGAATERLQSTSLRTPGKLASVYGRLNYGFADKYLATFTWRADGSSQFGPNNRWGYFPSGSLAWRLSKEDFIADLNIFSDLKLRAGYGATGNDRIPPYGYMATFGPTGVSLDASSALSGGIVAKTLPNPDLKWESNAQLNIGLDMGFVQNRILATVDFYQKKTTDLIADLPIGQWWGFATQLANVGSLQNTGIEFAINTENIVRGDFRWSTNFNIAYNKQKVTDLGDRKYIRAQTANPDGSVPASDFTQLEVGKELSMLYGYVYEGVIKTGEKYSPQPNSVAGDPKFKDVDGDGSITAGDRTYLGNANPHYVFGLNNEFTYKGIEFAIFFQGALDYSLYNMNGLLLETYTGVEAKNRWTVNNENTNVPRNGYFTTKYGNYIHSKFVEDASYLRCKMVTLAYNLPLGSLKNKIRNIKVYTTVQNLFTVTGYTGTDPEVNTNGGNANLTAGLDFNAFPAYRTVTFGAKLNF